MATQELDKMGLWNRVCKSDPKHLKQVGFGKRKFHAIDAQYQVRSATEEFGPIGEGWGYDVEYRYIGNGAGSEETMAVVAEVRVWYQKGDRLCRCGIESGCRTFLKDGKFNEDAPKMACTDGLTKSLSRLGFNADVFLGEFDGNKYVADEGGNSKAPKASDKSNETPFTTASKGF